MFYSQDYQQERGQEVSYYKIIETPGKRGVNVEEELGEEVTINSQDIAKTVVARLRAKAKREKRQVDYVIQRDTERANNSNGATSIRLSESTRLKLAKYVGRHMAKTGETISMGDAVEKLLRRVVKLEVLHEHSDENSA